jgi:hypothetical protein
VPPAMHKISARCRPIVARCRARIADTLLGSLKMIAAAFISRPAFKDLARLDERGIERAAAHFVLRDEVMLRGQNTPNPSKSSMRDSHTQHREGHASRRPGPAILIDPSLATSTSPCD